MMTIKKRWSSKAGQYYYTIHFAGNHEAAVKSTDFHPRREDMDHAVDLFLQAGLNAEVVDLTAADKSHRTSE